MGQQLPSPALAVGIDVGGTSVKGAVVRVSRGEVASAVVRRRTPDPARIDDVVRVIAGVADDLSGMQADPALPVGVALSGDVRDGRHTTGVNLHHSWIDAPARDLLETAIGRPVTILNDADAAAIGERGFGAAAGVPGVVVVLTFGTGIGSAILVDGRLLPNSGLGQLPFKDRPVEQLLSAVARERRGIPWRGWADEVSAYLAAIDLLLRPDLFVIGGGVVNAWPEFWDLLRSPCPLVPATLGDRAGILGAAITAGSDVPSAGLEAP